MEELTISYFNSAYDDMYDNVIAYVITRCNDVAFVEDIVQDTFSDFYNLLCRKGIDYINQRDAIIMKIAKYKVYKYYAKKAKQSYCIPLEVIEQSKDYNYLADDSYEVEDKYINKDLKDRIWVTIKEMPKDVQKIFALRYYLDKSIADIAEIMSLTESNVKHKIYRTIEKLRKLYQKE